MSIDVEINLLSLVDGSLTGVAKTVKDYVSLENFKKLPVHCQQHLLKLLPKSDCILRDDGLLEPTFSALKNEYLSVALVDYQDRLYSGEALPFGEIIPVPTTPPQSVKSRVPSGQSEASSSMASRNSVSRPSSSKIKDVQQASSSSSSITNGNKGGRTVRKRSNRLSVKDEMKEENGNSSSGENLPRHMWKTAKGLSMVPMIVAMSPDLADMDSAIQSDTQPRKSNRGRPLQRKRPRGGKTKKTDSDSNDKTYLVIKTRPFPRLSSISSRSKAQPVLTSPQSVSALPRRGPGRPPKSASAPRIASNIPVPAETLPIPPPLPRVRINLIAKQVTMIDPADWSINSIGPGHTNGGEHLASNGQGPNGDRRHNVTTSDNTTEIDLTPYFVESTV